MTVALEPQRTRLESLSLAAHWRLGRHSLPAVLVLTLVTALGFFRRTSPDFWWHLRAGRDILASHQIPTVDAYSHTVPGAHWVAHEWLWEVLLALVMEWSGYRGVSTLLAGFLLMIFGLLYLLLRARGLNEWPAACLVALGALMSLQTLTPRPHIFTYLCVVVTIWLLDWWRQGHERRLWWLVPLLLVWANMHGGYAIGLGILGLALVGELIEAWQGGRSARVKTLGSVLIAGGLVASVNPQGPAIHLFALSFLSRDSAMQQYIIEWASPDFHTGPAMAFAVALLLLLVAGLRPRVIGWTNVLLTLVFVWMGLQAVRHLPLFALVGLPALASGLATWRPVRARPRDQEARGPALVNWLCAVLIVGVTLVTLLRHPLAQVSQHPGEEWYPSAALAYLKSERPAGPIFNYDGWGGYLIARAPDYPVFIDGRTDLYGREMLETYLRVIRLQPGWHEVLDRYGVRLVLVQRDQALANALREHPSWEVLVEGDVELLLARRA